MSAAPTIIDTLADQRLFQPWFTGSTWDNWRTILKAAFALPLDDGEVEFFKTVSGGRDLPTRPVSELWNVAGRRAGKDSIASVIGSHAAAMFENTGQLRGGERAMVACLASDKDQAKIILNFAKSYFNDIAELRAMVERETANGFELSNGVEIAITTSSFRAVRGRPILCAVLDEVAFWRDENSATPDEEVYRALKPGLASIGGLLIGISSPYRRAGLLYAKYKKHFGKNDDDVLVIQAPTRTLNPTIPQSVVDAALADDPASARAEWLAEFRTDIESFISVEILERCVTPGVAERPRVDGVQYRAFCDPSGGQNDSMTLGISHSEFDKDRGRNVGVLDVVREICAPFVPTDAVKEFSDLLKKGYGIHSVRGDRYGAAWVSESFKQHGIDYVTSDLSKSDIYKEVLPRLNSGDVELLDVPRLITQLAGLERRTARGGRDSIDHPPGNGPASRDDVANAAAGALIQATAVRYEHRPPTFGVWGSSGIRWAGEKTRLELRLEREAESSRPKIDFSMDNRADAHAARKEN